MRGAVACTIGGWCAAVLAATHACAEPVLLDGVTAYVNSHVVRVSDVLGAIEPARRTLARRYEGVELKTKLRDAFEEARDSMVERCFVLDAFDKEKGSVPDWMLDQRIGELIHESFEDDRDAFLTALANDRIGYDRWRERMRESIIVSNMRKMKVDRYVWVSPTAVRGEYDRNRADYESAVKVHLRMIVVDKNAAGRTPDAARAKAEAAKKRLDAGEEFASVAREFSEETKADLGGDRGWVDPERTLRPELAKAALALRPPETSGLVETEDSFYILRAEERQGGVVKPFEEVQESIERKLRQVESERLYDEWVGRLRRHAYTRVLDRYPF